MSLIPAQQPRHAGPPALAIIGTTMVDPSRVHSTVLACPEPWCEAPTGRPCINPLLPIADQVLHYAVHATRPTVATAVRDEHRGVDTVARLDHDAQTRATMHRQLHESHPCRTPGCNAAGRVPLLAAAPGRLAGVDWIAGDVVDFCADHLSELIDASTAERRDDMPEWIAVDAKPTDADLWGDLLNAPTVAAAEALSAELRRRGAVAELA
jgi:hypothetical protein